MQGAPVPTAAAPTSGPPSSIAAKDVVVKLPEVQLHKVENGVESLLEWGPLALGLEGGEQTSAVVVQVGQTKWPVTSDTPTLKATALTYMFAMPQPNLFYSVILSPGTAPEDAALFEATLAECTSFQMAGGLTKQGREELVEEVAQAIMEETPNVGSLTPAVPAVSPAGAATSALPGAAPGVPGAAPTTSDRITQGALMAKDFIASAANYAGRGILKGGEMVQQRVQPRAQPVNISPESKARVKRAATVAHKGAGYANRVAVGVADVTVRIADSIVRKLAPRYEKPPGQQQNGKASNVQSAREIAAAAVLAATEVYESLEEASRVVLNSGGEATSKFVHHRYGPDAGEVAADTASATIDSGMAAFTMSRMGVKTVARKIAKRTAKGLAKATILGEQPPPRTTASGAGLAGSAVPLQSAQPLYQPPQPAYG